MAYNKFENFARWFAYKLKLQTKFEKNNLSHWKVCRSDIYTCYFGENIGFEKSRLEARPCVIISTDDINHESGNVIVAPMTKTIKYDKYDPKKLKYDWNYVLYNSKYPKLKCNSMVQCEDMRCVSKIRLGTYIDHLDVTDRNNLKKRIKRALQV